MTQKKVKWIDSKKKRFYSEIKDYCSGNFLSVTIPLKNFKACFMQLYNTKLY